MSEKGILVTYARGCTAQTVAIDFNFIADLDRQLDLEYGLLKKLKLIRRLLHSSLPKMMDFLVA